LKGRSGHGARGLSPATVVSKKNVDDGTTSTSSAAAASKRFWDGFQWVERAQAPVGVAVEDSLIANQTRQERRLYVGNLLPSCTPQMLTDFMNLCMESCLTGANITLPDGYTKAVLSVWIAPQQNYAFVEFVTKECAVIAMGLTGITFMGQPLKIKRPNNFIGQMDESSSALLAVALQGIGAAPTNPYLHVVNPLSVITPIPAATANVTTQPTAQGWSFPVTTSTVVKHQMHSNLHPQVQTSPQSQTGLVNPRRDNRPAWMTNNDQQL
jgi:hypothetical protein